MLLSVLACFLGSSLASHSAEAEKADWYPQSSEWQADSLCGINSLYVLLRLKGAQISYSLLRSNFDVHPTLGVSLADLQKQAVLNGLPCNLVQSSPEAFKNLTRPFIAHLERQSDRGHYVVVIDSDDEAVHIVDGQSQVRHVALWQFERLWTGYCLLPVSGWGGLQWHWVISISLGIGIGVTMFALVIATWLGLTVGHE